MPNVIVNVLTALRKSNLMDKQTNKQGIKKTFLSLLFHVKSGVRIIFEGETWCNATELQQIHIVSRLCFF